MATEKKEESVKEEKTAPKKEEVVLEDEFGNELDPRSVVTLPNLGGELEELKGEDGHPATVENPSERHKFGFTFDQ